MSENEATTTEAPKKPRIHDTDFVKACLSCKSASEVADAVGLTVESVAARARKLRKAGVKLPAFPRSRQGINVDALNTLIESGVPND